MTLLSGLTGVAKIPKILPAGRVWGTARESVSSGCYLQSEGVLPSQMS